MTPAALDEIYRTGRGSFKVRARWRYNKEENLIEVYEIPYSTTSEAIIDKVTELLKAGRLKEIADIRDETDLSGLKLTIDLKRGTDPGQADAEAVPPHPPPGQPVLQLQHPHRRHAQGHGGAGDPGGVGGLAHGVSAPAGILLHEQEEGEAPPVEGLRRILLDIDRAIQIIRETEEDAEVVPNLMIGFGIDQVQAEYVADIRLRNINKEYILKRTQEVEALEGEIADLEDTVNSPRRIRNIIAGELKQVKEKYSLPRRTEILYDIQEDQDQGEEDETPDYPVHLFLSREGYLKKITPQSLRMSGEQKYKEGDGPYLQWEATNRDELLVFTDKSSAIRPACPTSTTPRPAFWGTICPPSWPWSRRSGLCGPVSRGTTPGSCCSSLKTARRHGWSCPPIRPRPGGKSSPGPIRTSPPWRPPFLLGEDFEAAVITTEGRCMIFHTASLNPKTTRSTQGVNVMTLKPKYHVEKVLPLEQTAIVNPARYRARSLPVAGALLKEEDRGEEQLTLL